MLDSVLIAIVIIAKYLLPIATVFFPFAAGWSNFVLDTIDGDILIPLGLADNNYQLIDKLADWCTYIGMVWAAYRFKWPIKKAVLVLFSLRTVGQLLFFITRDERLFFLFPNFLEPLFLIYASIVFFKHKKAPKVYQKYFWLIWIFVITYKLQDEYITHIGNIDRSELINRLLGL